ncbi:hypothetical protein [Hydrogenophaga sp.]|uniref:hypothetical protein n=1 Tax=Hydrogenophaga sp. TaxID=1904254 RepID=UPI002717DFDD|nr:hypothetical protein [Hydrogenophaga sp.]MDO9436750.1 hypothetical protein [Hydrogenophaga sp.]
MPTTIDHAEPLEATAESLLGPLPANMEQLSQLLLAANAAGESGQTLADTKGLAAAELHGLYDIALSLCDQRQWSAALLIALQLAMHDPRNARFLFLAGMCLQHMQEFQAAASLFGLCLIDQEEPIYVFRMAECLAASGAFAPAREAFETCHELCRGRFELRDMQDACADALTLLTSH